MALDHGDTMKIAIVGAGGHGGAVFDCLSVVHGTTLEASFYDDAPERRSVFGVPITGPVSLLVADESSQLVFVAIGDNRRRQEVTRLLAKAGKSFGTILHPFTAISPRATIGDGTIAVAGTIVNAGARVGDGVILNTHSSVGHDCVVEDFAQVAPGVNLGGGSAIEEGAFLGIGAKVAPLVSVGAWAVVGAGSVVLEDLPPRSFAYGAPAKVIRSIEIQPPG
jgi:sugar O-acyltransferase (sialic acid O-acetyltransferase NeuD family)